VYPALSDSIIATLKIYFSLYLLQFKHLKKAIAIKIRHSEPESRLKKEVKLQPVKNILLIINCKTFFALQLHVFGGMVATCNTRITACGFFIIDWPLILSVSEEHFL
jgi:hypothetical protein